MTVGGDEAPSPNIGCEPIVLRCVRSIVSVTASCALTSTAKEAPSELMAQDCEQLFSLVAYVRPVR